MSRKNIIIISLFSLSFLVSLTSYIVKENKYSRITFKFYNELTHKIVQEDRYIILHGDKDHIAETIVQELFLGPMSVFNHKIVSYDTMYNLFYINEKVAYLDMPIEFLTGFKESHYTFEETVSLIKENIYDNIPGINQIILTIDGESIGSGPSKSLLPQAE